MGGRNAAFFLPFLNFCIDKTIPNGTVLSDKSHEGVDNQASYIVDTDNGSYDKCDSNVVTVKPGEEKPEIEKYINQAVHKDITLDEVFTYDIIAWVTNDADVVTITDELTGKIKFAADPAVKVVDLGADDNHKVTNDISNTKVNDDATVAQAGTAVANADIKTEGKTLTVTIPDATANRGHWVKVTFDAQLDAASVEDAKTAYTDIAGAANAPVISAEDHTGVPNTASYEIGVKKTVVDENGNETTEVEKKHEDESNTVTVKPEEETKVNVNISKADMNGKEVEGAVIVVKDADGNTVDEWVSTKQIHTVKDLAPGTYTLIEEVAPAGFKTVKTDIVFNVDAEGKVTVTDVKVVDGKVEVDENGTLVLFDEPDAAEIEKYVNQAVHKDIALDEVFTYDVIAYITEDADIVTITDTLTGKVKFAADPAVKVVDLGASNNHKVTNNINNEQVNADATVAVAGAAVANAQTNIDGKTLTVTIPDATANRGHWVKVTFNAQLDAASVAEAETAYEAIAAAANAPVISAEDHTGVPNTASYEIGVKHVNTDENGNVVRDENGNVVKEDEAVKTYEDSSNTVTVKTEEPEVEEHKITISKSSLGGSEIAGATITVTGDNFSETWTSTTEAHELTLKPGRYTMVEVVAPEGFQQVTTEMVFTVDENGKVTLETTAVDGGGRLTAENDHINLEDAPIKPIDIVLEAQKVLEGGNLTAGQFNFAASLTGVTVKDNPVVIPFDAANADRNAANDGTGKVTFDKFEISEEGVYTYTIAEIAGDNADIIYDSALQSVTVTVTKQSVGEGINRGDVLVAEVVYDEGAGATFTNKVRQPGETEVNITGNKTLKVNDSDAPVAAGEFSFQILEKGAVYTDAENSYEYPVDNAPVIRTVTNDGNGVIDFGSFSYSSPGTYSYYLSEVAGNDELTTYDANVFVVEVNVTEGEDAVAEDGTVTKTLTANVTYPEGGVTFTNSRIEKKPVVISKTDMTTGNELPGATLIITDATGAEVTRWVSSNEAHTVELAPGNYTLTEVTAPFGYNVAESITFTVGHDGLVGSDKVEMKDSADTIRERFDISVIIDKKWTDGYGNDVRWPEGVSVEFTLQFFDRYTNSWVDYAPYGTPKKVTLDANKTSDTFDDLPAEIDGATAQYRAVETKIAGYTQATSTVTDIANKVGTMTAVNIPEIPQDQTVYISKNSLGGSEIAGAHIVVYDAAGAVVNEWTSTTEAHELTLKPGTYTMVETVAPEGYRQVTTAITFTVNANGNVTLGTTTVDNGGKISVMDANHVILEDAPIPEIQKHTVKISKTDLGGTEIEGATIVIKDAAGNVVDEWTSDKTIHEIQLPAGTYTMIETVAPQGYEKVKTEITFMVDEDGKVTLLTTSVEGGEVEFKDGVIVLKDAPIKVPTETTTPTPTPTKTPTTPNTPATSRRTVTTPASSASVSKATSTGDSNNTVLWIVIAAIAAAAIAGAGVAVTRRRRRD